MGMLRKFEEGCRWIGTRKTARGGVLLYHRVAPPVDDPFRLCVSPENFAEQMEVLATRQKALSHHELLRRQEEGCLQPGSVCVTFDDGYLDVFETALPILERYEIPVTVFVTTGNPGRPFWWDRLYAILDKVELADDILLTDHEQTVIPLAGGGVRESYDRVYGLLRHKDPGVREELVDAIASSLGISGECEGLPRAASEDELRRAAEHPLVSLQAHTVSHSPLAELSPAEQVAEMQSSAKRLEEITGKTVDSISYPFGLQDRDYDETTLRSVSEAGLHYGFAADRGVVTSETSPLAIPRLWVHDRSGRAFRRQLAFWLGAGSADPIAAAA